MVILRLQHCNIQVKQLCCFLFDKEWHNITGKKDTNLSSLFQFNNVFEANVEIA